MEFAAKIWLAAAAAALPLMVLLYYKSEKRKWHKLESFVASKLLHELTASYSAWRCRTKIGLITCGTIFLILALARPQWGHDWEEARGRGIDILIALDTSRSMLAEDIKPNRLERAKFAILDLLESIEGDRVGLIAFAGSAFLQCPLTLDTDAFRQTLETIDTDIIKRAGSDLAAAIAEAEASFAKDDNYRFLVLITDGEDLEASGITRAREAAQNDVTIFTVGVGHSEGELIPVTQEDGSIDFLRDEYQNLVRTRLDEETLGAIARTSKGFYVPLGSQGEGLEAVYSRGLSAVPKQEREARLHKFPIERFQWPLLFALAVLLIEPVLGTRKRTIPARAAGESWMLALTLLALVSFSHTLPASPREAEKSYHAGSFEEASESYRAAADGAPDDARLHYNLGASLYRSSEFDSAAGSLTDALKTDDVQLQQDAFYNLGNSHFRMGEGMLQTNPEKTIEHWEESLRDYENAINLSETDEDAKYNYQYVKQRLEQLKQQQQEQQQDEKQDQDEQQSQDQQSQSQEKEANEQSESEQNNQGEQEQQQSQKDQKQKESSQENQQQESREQESDQQQDSQAQQQEAQKQPGKDEQQPQATQPVQGRMTREEARQLLESLREDEKKLPVGLLRVEESKSASTGRDW